MPYRLRFDQKKCVGCFACHMACLDAHYDAEEADAESFRAIRAIRDQKKGFEKDVCPGCVHCGKCMEACPSGAVYRDRETGFILTDREKCTGCRKCESACPLQVIRFDKEAKMAKCDGCIGRIKEGREPACVRVCLLKAIRLEEYEGEV